MAEFFFEIGKSRSKKYSDGNDEFITMFRTHTTFPLKTLHIEHILFQMINCKFGYK